MIDLKEQFRRYGFKPRGVIHVGAHEGEELAVYRELGIENILFIEANPEVYARLVEKLDGEAGIGTACCAVTDHSGECELHVTSMDQSSSVLALKRHAEIYPEIRETTVIQVPCRTLDDLMDELGLDSEAFDFLNLDIQGAELLALAGAERTLQHLWAVNAEVNFEELYEGCALVDALERFLHERGFHRSALATPYHPSWGDGLYLRKPAVAMSTLGCNGRFANQLFQYAFLHLYAKAHGALLQTPPWIGQPIFGLDAPPVQAIFPRFEQCQPDSEAWLLSEAATPLLNLDFKGFFQFHSKAYAPYREELLHLFKPVHALQYQLFKGLAKARSGGRTLIGLHIRRGDYGYGPFFSAPCAWYREWLMEIWPQMEAPVVFLASDDLEQVKPHFAGFPVLTAKDLGTELAGAEEYLDFYYLTQCDALAISNSSFSFMAAMLNRRIEWAVRPDPEQRKLVSFDPWDAPVILRQPMDPATQQAILKEGGEVSECPENPASASGSGASTPSQLDELIPAEIKNDEFHAIIQELAATLPVANVLEIGSSSGEGSTDAFVQGIKRNPGRPRLFCMEVSRVRFEALKARYDGEGFVKPYNVSSVPAGKFPSEAELVEFMRSNPTSLNQYPPEQVLGWLRQDLRYLRESGVPQDGIARIKRENGIEAFDLVLIDGSEFTGSAELEEVYGAQWILLDDINGYKNHRSYQRLKADPSYVLVRENWNLRSGYAVFMRKAAAAHDSGRLPVHFFTIVLNGEPFIRHHIEVFNRLPFEWHWHIIEGVAELKHDTAWSVAQGGRISDEIHARGRSLDGTSEYLDELARAYPGRVSLYRKPLGQFWDGKLEMVNAPLDHVQDGALLWQVDADELWSASQIVRMREMFLAEPDRTAAYFWCTYFVSPELVTTGRNCYGNQGRYEWLRVFRYRSGCRWTAHEPPVLCNAQGEDLARIRPFTHAETEARGLVFQHFAYAVEAQLAFKEVYYGYRKAVEGWRRLQGRTVFPVPLREFFPWVQDAVEVGRADVQGIVPLATCAEGAWCFFPETGSPKPPPAADPSRIAWVRLDAIGDNILAGGLLERVHARYPLAKLDVVCQAHVAELYEACPFVETIVSIDKGRALRDQAYLQEVLGRIGDLGADLCLHSVYSREPLGDAVAAATRAPRRITHYGDDHNRNAQDRPALDALYTELVPPLEGWISESDAHQAFQAHLGVHAEAPGPRIWTREADRDSVERRLSELSLGGRPLLVLFPGAQWDARVYGHYAAALRPLLAERKDLAVVAIGTAQEAALAQSILDALPGGGTNLCGQLTLRECAVLMRTASLGIGAESGLAHMACAVGLRNVAVLGGGHFARFMPQSPWSVCAVLPLDCYFCDWSCRWGRAHCVKDLDPGVLGRAVREAMAGDSPVPRLVMQDRFAFPGQGPSWMDLRPLVDSGRVAILVAEPGAEGGSSPESEPLPKTTVFCAVWHKDPERMERLVAHQACLDAQSVPVERVYVFDGGDAPPAWLKGRALTSREPLSIYEAWNLALADVRTPYVMNLNLDDRLCREGVQVLEKTLDAGMDLAGGDWRICFDQAETDATGACVRSDTIPFRPEWPPAMGGPVRLGSGTGERGTFGPATLWKTSLHRELGSYPSRFADGSPVRVIGDALWWQMIQNAGKKVYRLPFIIGHYHSHPTDQAEFRNPAEEEHAKIQTVGLER